MFIFLSEREDYEHFYMLNMKKLLYIVCALTLLLTACQRTPHSASRIPQNAYAQGFALIEHDNYTEAIVYSPWQQGEVLGHYYLIRDSSIQTPTDGKRIHVPIQRLAITSSTHAGFLNELSATHILCGACSPHLIYTPLPATCADLGDAMQLSSERVLLVHPEAIMMNTYGASDPIPARLQAAGIPILYNMEWTEQHPLGKAEWIRFVGALVGKQHEADSIFEAVAQQYNNYQLSIINYQLNKRRTILSGNNFRGTWYVPAGNTYMGQLFQHAGADYHFAEDTRTSSIPLSIETCLLHFQNADVWIGSNCHTLQELATTDEKHTWFKAYQTGEVYNFYRRTTPAGANDFWETGTVHPEYILSDLIWVLYPTLLPADYKPYFTNKLN